jgi:ATP-dependent DNA helicase
MPSIVSQETMEILLNPPKRLRTHKRTDDDDNDDDANAHNDAQAVLVARVKIILAPFVLRRLKSSVSGEIAPKRDVLVRCEMTGVQRDSYARLMSVSKETLYGARAAVSAAPVEVISLDDDDDGDDALVTAAAAARTRDDADDGDGDDTARARKRFRSTRSTSTPAAIKSPLARRASAARMPKSVFSNVLMQLRKMANHPLLCRLHYDDRRVAAVAHALRADVGGEFSEIETAHLIEDLKVRARSAWYTGAL